MRFTIRCGAALAKTVCEYGPAALDKAGVELLVIDQNEPAGATVAQHLDLPFVNMMAGLPLNREPQMPPPFVPWAHTGRFTTTLLNATAYAAFDTLVAPVNRVLNSYRRVWGLPQVRRPDDTFSQLAQLSQLTEDFDFPRVARPAAMVHLGPFKDNERASAPFPYERLNGKPLVYASLGTLQNRRERAFQIVAEACRDLDVQLVIAAGGGCALDPSRFSGNPILVKFAPQLELLARAAICITHGGMNTVLESLSFGVPMVVTPITNDHPAIAARVKHAGAGDVIAAHHLTGSRLREAVRRVLFEPQYRRRADYLKASIERAGGVARAADIVDTIARGGYRTALK